MAYNTMGEHCEIMEDDQPHGLFEQPQKAYTNLTVRRAFIVWLNRGQETKFKDICNYFHNLEEMEEFDMTPDQRASSRRLELNLFSPHNHVEQSQFVRNNYCHLYGAPVSESLIERAEAIRNETCIFKLHGFDAIDQKGLKTADLLAISKLVRDYCNQRNITLRKFLRHFIDHTNKCQLALTGLNVEFYVRNKQIEGELELLKQFPASMSFLDWPDYGDIGIVEKLKISIGSRRLCKGDKNNDYATRKAAMAKVVGKLKSKSVKYAFNSAPNIILPTTRSPTPTSSVSRKSSGAVPLEEYKDEAKSSDEGVVEDVDSEASSSCYTSLIPY